MDHIIKNYFIIIGDSDGKSFQNNPDATLILKHYHTKCVHKSATLFFLNVQIKPKNTQKSSKTFKRRVRIKTLAEL